MHRLDPSLRIGQNRLPLMIAIVLLLALGLSACAGAVLPGQDTAAPSAADDTAAPQEEPAGESGAEESGAEATTTPAEEPEATTAPLPEPTAEPSEEPAEVPAGEATEEPTEEPAGEPADAPNDAPSDAQSTDSTSETEAEPAATNREFRIVPEESEARFLIDEVLFGNPKTVVGRTNEVAGSLQVDMSSYSVEFMPISINARDLETDDSFRNRAIRSQILDSNDDAYQFITFTPTSVSGIPATVDVGSAFVIQVEGELQIRDITQTQIFEITVTPVSEAEISGTGRAQVLRGDYDLRIPNVPGVANVSEEVILEIDFTARAQP